MLGPENILLRHPKVWNRVEVVHAGGVEETGEVDRVLGRVDGDLHDTIGDDGDCSLGIAAGSAQVPRWSAEVSGRQRRGTNR